MRLSIDHTTSYAYDEPPVYGLQQVRLIPKDRSYQSVVEWDLLVDGGTIEAAFEDQHSNPTRLIRIAPNQSEVTLRSTGIVKTKDVSGVIGRHAGFAPLWLFQRETPLTKPGPELRKLLRASDPGADTEDIPRLHQLSRSIYEAVSYQTGTTQSKTTGEEALIEGSGVCQDHAHIMITLARLLGFPARYVSGYLMMNDRIDQDATHAWAEVYIQDLGWLAFDISNQVSPDERYVHIATGLDYADAAPISGMRFGAGHETLSVSLQVQQ